MDPARPDARLADAGLALATALVLAVVVAAGPREGGTVPALAACAGIGALLLLRRRAPVLVLVVTVGAIFAYYIADLPPLGMVLPAAGALLSAAEQGRTRWAIGAAAVLLAVSSYYRLAVPDPADAVSGYGYVTELALAAAAIALGAAVRLARQARERTRRIEELTAERQARAAADRLQQERLRTARDLHDSIGHALAVASLHAGIATDALEDADPAAREALGQVRASTAQALAELRGTVRVLRGQAEPTGADAAVGLAALDALLADARGTGLEVVVRTEGELDHLPGGIDTTACRIIQESLTNVLRHSGARRAEIDLAARDGALALSIRDDGPAREPLPADELVQTGGSVQTDGSAPAPGADAPARARVDAPARARVDAPAGAGIRGMRERAALHGGTVHAGPEGSGFAVRAHFPLHRETP